MSQHIVIVDDDVDLTQMMRRFLERQGFSVDILHSGEAALERIQRIQPDLLVLDLMLPGMDGMTICRHLRPAFTQPILMLTALADDADQIRGLNQGADDYLPKPVKPNVLLARIHALLRRHRHDRQKDDAIEDTSHQCGALRIDLARRSVFYHDQCLSLSTREFDLLHYLCRHPGKVLSRDRLYQAMFQCPYDGVDRALDVLISRLRKRLPTTAGNIQTLRGQGYIFTPSSL